MRKKQGITVLTLSIAVAVIVILTSVTIVNIENIIPTAKKTKIAEEFKLIEDNVKEYYLTYGNYPVLNNTTYTKAELISLNTVGKSNTLSAEISKNGDDDSVFFLVDLDRLRITTLKYGKNVTADDIYVVSDITGAVYYPKGVLVNNTTVFSSKSFENTNNV